MSAARGICVVVIALVAGAGCGVVNGLGGPWPPAKWGPDAGPVEGCPPSTHDGGDGACVAVGTCADGFVLEGAGRCARWEPRASAPTALSAHTATLLDDGRVLVLGGVDGDNELLVSGSVYAPREDAWESTAGTARYFHAAVRLPGGAVLALGGRGDDDATLDTAARWVEGDVFETLPMTVPRDSHTATVLDDGRVLVVGGGTDANAGVDAWPTLEVFAGDRFTALAAELPEGRTLHTATRLDDGRVLIAGGTSSLASGSAPLASAFLFDASDDSLTATGALGVARLRHSATRLADGRVLVLGGQDERGLIASAELYDPASGEWTLVDGATLTVPRSGHSATPDADGRVVVTGGFSGNEDDALPIAVVEVFDPGRARFSRSAPLGVARSEHPALALDDGSVLVVHGGGDALFGAPAATVERLVVGE